MKILIIRLSSLGDVVLAQSVAAVLRAKYPAAEIHFIVKNAFVPVVEAFGCIDQIHIWEENNSFSKLRELGSQKYDLTIDLQAKFNSFLIRKLVRSKKTVTYDKHHFLRLMIVKHKTKKSISSTVDLYFSALKKAGIREKMRFPELHPVQELPKERAKLIKPEKRNVAIFPGALHRTKQYPLKKMAEFINLLEDCYNVFLLGSAAEKGLAAEVVARLRKPVHNLAGNLKIADLISFLDRVDVVISNDSGPMHIAAALGKPQIAIFGATHPRLGFAPLNKSAIVLAANLKCQPCSLHGGKFCPELHFECMHSLSFWLIKTKLNSIFGEE